MFIPSKESLKSRELYAVFIEVARDAILSQNGPELLAGSRHRNTQGWLVVTQPSEPISLKKIQLIYSVWKKVFIHTKPRDSGL